MVHAFGQLSDGVCWSSAVINAARYGQRDGHHVLGPLYALRIEAHSKYAIPHHLGCIIRYQVSTNLKFDGLQIDEEKYRCQQKIAHMLKPGLKEV